MKILKILDKRDFEDNYKLKVLIEGISTPIWITRNEFYNCYNNKDNNNNQLSKIENNNNNKTISRINYFNNINILDTFISYYLELDDIYDQEILNNKISKIDYKKAKILDHFYIKGHLHFKIIFSKDHKCIYNRNYVIQNMENILLEYYETILKIKNSTEYDLSKIVN